MMHLASGRRRPTTTSIKAKFAEARDLRLGYRPQGHVAVHLRLLRRAGQVRDRPARRAGAATRAPITDEVEVLFIGGGFSALLTAARLRERGVESIRIVERGADVGGTWYWNRYPGAACDVPSYDYLPLLDEMGYVPSRLYAKGPEIYAHCQAIAKPLRPLRPGRLPHDGADDHLGQGRQALGAGHRPRRCDARQVRDLRQRHALEAQALEDRGHGELRRPLVPLLALGLRLHRRATWRTCRTRWSASSAPAPRPCRRSRASAKTAKAALRLPAHALGHRHPRRPPDRSGLGRAARARLAAGAADEAHPRPRRGPASARPSSPQLSREEKIRRQENEQHRPHDAHPPAHRRDRRRQGDRRRAEALVHVHVQAAVLRRRLPAGLQPAERPSGRHPGQGDHRDRPGGAGVRGRSATRSTF